jgi:hypothetical protein
MDVKYISFQLKNQLKLFVGERSKVIFDSGCKIFDVHLMENAAVIFLSRSISSLIITPYHLFKFDTITFQNFYTSYLTIKAKEKKDKFHISNSNIEFD